MKLPNLEEKIGSDRFSADNLCIRHLQVELARIDIHIKREIYRWQLAGQEPSDNFRGLYVSDQQAIDMMDRPICTNWGYSGIFKSENIQSFEESLTQANLNAKAIANTLYSQGHKPQLHHLRDIFGLSDFDVDVLLICLAPSFDLRYENIFGYLQDNITRKNPSVNLVIDLLSETGPNRIEKYAHFSDSAPLFRNHLIRFNSENGSNQSLLLRKTITLDPTISAWLFGEYQPDPQIRRYTRICHGPYFPENLLLPDAILSQLELAIKGVPILIFYGPDQIRKDAAASYISTLQKRPLIKVDLSTLKETGEIPLEGMRAY